MRRVIPTNPMVDSIFDLVIYSSSTVELSSTSYGYILDFFLTYNEDNKKFPPAQKIRLQTTPHALNCDGDEESVLR